MKRFSFLVTGIAAATVLLGMGEWRVAGGNGRSALAGTLQTPPPTFTPWPSPSPTPPPFTTVYVPHDFRTIQEALDQAVAHTRILVAPGTYEENLVWPRSAGIRLEADGDPGSVVVDGTFTDRVLTISDVLNPGATVTGLRLTRGRHTGGGAGVFIRESTVLLYGCEIFDNEADAVGLTLHRPGIDCRESNLVMINCHVHDHLASLSDGCALTVSNTGQAVRLEGCIFTGNYLLSGEGYASGISHLGGTLIARNCVFSDNGTENGPVLLCLDTNRIETCLFYGFPEGLPGGAAVVLAQDESMFLYNTVSDIRGTGIAVTGSGCLIRGNIVARNDLGISAEPGDGACLEYNDVWSNGVDYSGLSAGASDLCVDPEFVAGPRDFYYLSQSAAGQALDSPCLDAGDPLTDPTGFTRTDHVFDSGVIDMGFHRDPDLAPAVPTWTPTPDATHPHDTPTATPVHPTTTPANGTILVPEHYATIQEAIDAAPEGSTVNVGPGVFSGTGNRDLSFKGKAITVESRNGPAATVIDCGGSLANPHRAFIFEQNESSCSVLRGFTIRNGYQVEGGGIKIRKGANPAIQNCRITICYATSYGGGICADDSNFILESSTISECFASDGGGGLAISGEASVSTIIYLTAFQDNNCSMHPAGGGGIFIRDQAKPYLTSCTFTGNQNLAILVDSGNGNPIQIANTLVTNNIEGVEVRSGKVDLVNCTLSKNSRFAVKGNPPSGRVNIMRICAWGPEDFVLDIGEAQYSNYPGGDLKDKSFHADPLFVRGRFGDYYIQQDSESDPISPNVNRGGAAAFFVSFQGPGYRINLSDLTTAKDEDPDDRFADIGYHYNPSNLGPTPTPEPTHGRPIIEDVLGSTEHFDSTSETVFWISARVDHPLGPDYIESVELYLGDNIPLEFYLYDHDHDGRYTNELHFVTGEAQSVEYLLNVVAFGRNGYPSEMVPYILKTDASHETSLPEIEGRYLWFSLIEPGKNELGFIWFLTRVTHPLGPDYIDRVELLYEGVPTGIRLYDDGFHQDISAHDGYFGTMVLLNGIQISQSVEALMDVQATDRDGAVSPAWPVAWKTR